MLPKEKQRSLLALSRRIEAKFDTDDWLKVGLLAGISNEIGGHPRLLRSLRFNDEDYGACVLEIVMKVATTDTEALSVIEQYVHDNYSDGTVYVSAMPSDNAITFAPQVFSVPECDVESNLVSVMMPFSASFHQVYTVIQSACADSGLKCLRADDIWETATIIQDVFNLIFRSRIVVADFSGKNPNVMYEAGIAHTLGKHVVPLSQHLDDIPFDMRHLRFLHYLNNGEGLRAMRVKLTEKLRSL